MIISDLTLSQKLERTEACSNAAFVETRARLLPESGATWVEIAGAYAMFDGVGSPCTQTFGLGLFGEISSREMEEIESFFIDRGSAVFHEVSPMADPSLLSLLNECGYHPVELTSVMYRSLDYVSNNIRRDKPALSTRVISPYEVDLWARTSSAGWVTVHEGLADFMFDFGRISAQCAGAFPYLAELNGAAIATGMMFVHDHVAMLAGASTIPEARSNGAQNALLSARLSHATELGCKLAIMGASPGSQSQRNAQKNGFEIAYTRTKWQLVK